MHPALFLLLAPLLFIGLLLASVLIAAGGAVALAVARRERLGEVSRSGCTGCLAAGGVVGALGCLMFLALTVVGTVLAAGVALVARDRQALELRRGPPVQRTSEEERSGPQLHLAFETEGALTSEVARLVAEVVGEGFRLHVRRPDPARPERSRLEFRGPFRGQGLLELRATIELELEALRRRLPADARLELATLGLEER